MEIHSIDKDGEDTVVTLNGEFKVRFFVEGLSDWEYIRRAKLILELECLKKDTD